MRKSLRGVFALFLTLLLVAQVATAAPATNNEVNWDDENAVKPYLYEETLTVAEHNRSIHGPMQYNDDNGDVADLPAELNESYNNSFRVRADKIDDETLSAFPRKDDEDGNNTASALDDSEWTKSMSDSSGTASVGAGNMEASGIQFDAHGQGSGDEAKFTYDNFTIDTDVSKRSALLVGTVETLDASTNISFRYQESDGDYREVNITSNRNYNATDVAANSTANGMIYQQKLNNLPVEGSGDGSHDSIDKIVVHISDGDGKISLNGMDVDRKSNISFGIEKKDTDSDDDLETVTHEVNPDGGSLKIHDLDTMGTWANDASVYDLEIKGVEYRSKFVDSEDVFSNFTSADDYPNYAQIHDLHVRLKIPTAIDLSHSGLELRDEQSLVEERYISYEYAEGVGEDEDPDDVNSWTDESGTLASVGDMLTLDTTVNADEYIMFHVETKRTDKEASQLQATGGAGGASGTGSSILDFLFSVPGMILTGIGSFLGLRRIGG